MGFQDRRYREQDGEGGGFRRALRRIFVEGDDFFSWAFPLFTVRGVRVRVHLLFVLFVIVELLMSLPHGARGMGFTAVFMACLFGMVLLHEFGHVAACRRVGGEANDILLWPLGGLASCSPPHTWRAHFITTAGGPLVNVALIPVLAGLMLLAGAHPGQLLFNLAGHSQAIVYLGFGAWWKIAVFYAYYANIILLLFNVLVPMFPMDGARMAQALMWSRIGWKRSMQIAVNVGLVTAVVLVLVSMASPDLQRLFGLAVFGGLTCIVERQRLRMVDEDYFVGTPAEYGYGPRPAPAPPAVSGRAPAPERGYREALKRQQQAQSEQAEVDRILAKIAQEGMAALTRAERRVLERETERKRGQGGPGTGTAG